MSRLRLNKSEVGKTIKLNGHTYLFQTGNNLKGDLFYFLFGNNNELDGNLAVDMHGFEYSWAHDEMFDRTVTFKDRYSDALLHIPSEKATEKHLRDAQQPVGDNPYARIRVYRKYLDDKPKDPLTELRILKCCYTGRHFRQSDGIKTIDGLCHKSLKDSLVSCLSIGEFFLPKDGDIEIQGNGWVHHSMSHKVHTCSDCGTLFLADRPQRINTGSGERVVCRACFSNYRRCDHCGIYFIGDGHETVDGIACVTCAERMVECDHCHRMYVDEDNDGEHICSNCMGDVIKSYSTRFDLPNFGKRLMYGVEIELEVDEDDNRNTIAAKFKKKFGEKIMVKSDGSLNYGFEVVTRPFELNESMILCGDICDLAERHCRNDKSTTGVHVHVSRAALTPDQICRIVAIFGEIEDVVVEVAGRRSDQWAKVSKRKYKEVSEDGVDTFIRRESEGRYRAINLTNSSTVEFRVFKGTTDSDMMRIYLLFVSAVIAASKKLTAKDIDEGLTAEKVFQYTKGDSTYKPLIDFLTTHKIKI